MNGSIQNASVILNTVDIKQKVCYNLLIQFQHVNNRHKRNRHITIKVVYAIFLRIYPECMLYSKASLQPDKY